MAVRPETIDNQERGLGLRNRAEAPAAALNMTHPPTPREHPAVAELRDLRARIEAIAQAGEVPDPTPHCSDCFRRGVRSTLLAIRGE